MSNVTSSVGAGSDTTAISLSAVFHFIYSNPEALQKLREELEAAGLGDIPRFSDTQTSIFPGCGEGISSPAPWYGVSDVSRSS